MHFLIVKNAPPPSHPWEVVLPTQAVLNSNLVTPENFIQFCLPFKSYSWFSLTQTDRPTDGQTNRRTDQQMDGHTNSIQNESTHYPIRVRAEIFLYPIFSTSLKTEWACFTCSLRFVRINFVSLFYCYPKISFCNQCDQIGRFWKCLAINFLTKVAQVFWFYWKIHFCLVKTTIATFWATFYFSIWWHCLQCLDVTLDYLMEDVSVSLFIVNVRQIFAVKWTVT